MDEIIEKFHEDRNVVYTLMYEVDGEVMGKYTSRISADDVAGFAGLLDTHVSQFIASELAEEARERAEAIAESQFENERGN